MHRIHPVWKSRYSHFFIPVLASTAIFTAGCANMASTAAVSDSLPSTAAALTGHVHGGNQPIAFATVTINIAGTSGPGSVPTGGSVVATATTANDGFGSFSFIKDSTNGNSYPSSGNKYSCPTSGDPLVYIKAVGGNTQNTGGSSVNNTASIFLAPLGRCKEINSSTFLDITEVTTVATVAALQQYIDPVAGTIGADGTLVAYQAITNSFNLVSSLVNLSTGSAVTSTTFPGGSVNFSNGVSSTTPATSPVTPVSVTATPTVAKINTIANILAACVNSSSASDAPCAALFQYATPPNYAVTSRPTTGGPSFSTATNVLQAAYYMLTNPTDGSSSNLTQLFNVPVGLGAPFQPVLSNAPSDWTIAIAYSSSSTCGTNSGGFINTPYALDIDINGNLWVANGQTGSGNLSEITSTGTPVVCLALNANSVTNPAVSTTIDSAANIWQGSANSLTISRYTQSASNPTLSFTSTEAPIALAADGIGNVYFTTALGDLYQIPAGATTTTTVAPVLIATNLGTAPTSISIDDVTFTPQTGGIWTTSGSGQISHTVPTANNTDPAYQNGFSTTQLTTPSPSYGIAATHAILVSSVPTNNVLVSASGTTNVIDNLVGSGTSYATVSNWPTAAGLGGLNSPTGIALDGRANIWAANNLPSGGLGSLSEISAGEVALSPTTGLEQRASFSTANRSIVIDQSGNVWVGGDGSTFVTEIVGAAVPVYQPFSRALNQGRFQQIP